VSLAAALRLATVEPSQAAQTIPEDPPFNRPERLLQTNKRVSVVIEGILRESVYVFVNPPIRSSSAYYPTLISTLSEFLFSLLQLYLYHVSSTFRYAA
jgi:hypothetical protein